MQYAKRKLRSVSKKDVRYWFLSFGFNSWFHISCTRFLILAILNTSCKKSEDIKWHSWRNANEFSLVKSTYTLYLFCAISSFRHAFVFPLEGIRLRILHVVVVWQTLHWTYYWCMWPRVGGWMQQPKGFLSLLLIAKGLLAVLLCRRTNAVFIRSPSLILRPETNGPTDRRTDRGANERQIRPTKPNLWGRSLSYGQ